MPENLDAAKISFSEGNYQRAFHHLLPAAVEGNKEAQYAVGYMYYYGLGVPRDIESGIFWMKKAAEQHYAPAKDALRMINKATS